jgi:FixJ family two-component response regulator
MSILTIEPERAEPIQQQATVFIVEHDPESRREVRALAASVGLNAKAYASAQAFLGNCEPQMAGCLVLEVMLPGMTGLELQRRLAADDIVLPLIFTTVLDEVSTATKAMRAGALDFLVKPYSQQALLESIHTAIQIDRRRRREQAVRSERDARMAQLTDRQLQVLQLVVEGSKTKDIASQLNISSKTVDNHRVSAMEKMGVDSIAHLIRLMAGVESATAEDPA